MMNRSDLFQIAVRVGSTLFTLGFLFAIYWTLDTYDWGHSLVKLACFAALFVTIVSFQLFKSGGKASRTALWVELIVLLVILQAIFLFPFRQNAANLLDPPISDIGYTTVHAVKSLVNEQQNPYSRTDINTAQRELTAGYRGFHYGPFMMAGYLPSAFLGAYAYKMMGLVYVFLTLILLVLIVRRTDESHLEHTVNAAFVVTAYLIGSNFWSELLTEGANDVFHVMLLLIGLLALKKDRVFLAGLFTGLSIASKFAPGAFLVPFMPIKRKDFWLGLAIGLTPYIPFFLWDAGGIWRNAFWLRVIIPPNSTSLYWITPSGFQWIFGAVLLVSCFIAVMWAVRRKPEFQSTLVGFTLLLIVAEVTQKQIHGNHLLWFYPLFVLLFVDYRERIAGTFATIVPMPITDPDSKIGEHG